MHAYVTDTIAAIATPPGFGGIAVLRISGPKTLQTLHTLFVPAKRAGEGFAFRPRHMHYGHALDDKGEALDAVLAVYMPGPHSYTGEDVGEIHCHGGTGVSAALLESALAAGARLASPGEFTRRAFLNGRLDLAQAEAVAELISAPGREGARLAAAKLDGVLSRRIQGLRDSLDNMRTQIILAVDFPDEDAELLSQPAFEGAVQEALSAVEQLLAAFDRARLWREGALAVLAGRVNAGKSSLLNALLGRERAIVSAAPGTTRDYIEENVNLNGLPLRLVDTAGLRQGGDLVEEEGIRRSRDLAAEADLVLFVLDAGRPPEAQDRDFLHRHAHRVRQGRLLLVLNKIDTLPQNPPGPCGGAGADYARQLLSGAGIEDACACFMVSAREGLGIEALGRGIREALTAAGTSGSAGEGGGDIAPNLRQSQLLRQTRPELEALAAALAAGHPPDILGAHLDTILSLLDEVCGASGNEALLDRIFADFCIGK